MSILIVDDNAINRKLLKTLLIQENFSIVEAVDGLDALAKLRQEKIDLIISDILMPNMDGYRLCVGIRKSDEFKHIPLVFYTSTYTSSDDEKFAMEIGADRFIKKPASAKILIKVINELKATKNRYFSPSNTSTTELELLKSYNERLINKLEEKNFSLEKIKDNLLETNRQLTKRTEELQKSEKEIRDIFENIQDIFYRTDTKGILSMISPSIKHYGYQREELIGSNIDFIYADPKEKDLLIKTLVEKHLIAGLEIKLKHKNGKIFYASASGRLLVDDEANPIGIEGILHDISNRKFTEQCLEVQYTVVRLLADSDNLESVIEKILQTICENLEWDIAGFWLTQADGSLKQIGVWHSPTIEGIEYKKASEEKIFSKGMGIIGYIWETGKPLWRADLAVATDFLRGACINKLGLNSVLAVPIMLGKEILGIIEIFSRYIKPFNTTLLNIMMALGNQVGQFIERKRAELAKEERNRLSALSADISYSLIQNNNLQQMLDCCVKAINKHLNAAFTRIWIFNKSENILELQASAGMYTHIDGAYSKIPLGQLKIGLIAQERKPYLTNVVTSNSLITDQEWVKQESIAAFAGYPLVVAENLVGVLAIFAKQEFTETTLEAMKAIANEIAIGIERKRTEKELKDSEHRFILFMDNLPGIAFIKDKQGRFVYINSIVRKIFGITTSEWYNKTDNDLVSPELAAAYKENDQLVFKNKESIQVVEAVHQTDGIHQYLVSKFPIIDDYTGDVLLGGIAVDITERLVAEAELKEERALLAKRVEERTIELSIANAQLERAGKLKDEFLASMSHELRTPLNAILGLSEALQEGIYGSLTEKQSKSLSTIEESGRHLLVLINDILDLSKIEAGKLEMNLGTVSIEALCQASIRIIRDSAIKKQIKVFTMFDNTISTLQADERRLKQILVNLLSNAIKFTPKGGKIGLEVDTDLENKTISFTIWDTGIGISKEDLPRLFQPFVQLDSTLARQHNGTGLGLVLVKRMVEMLGGSVYVESELGKGSSFSISLPWIQSIDLISEELNISFEGLNIKQVLIIEDIPINSEQMTRYLTEIGVSVDVCTDGSQAARLATQLQPDVILLDILLPNLNGWEVLKQIKSNTETGKIPVIVVSVIDEREKALELGATDLLVKPITRLQLLNAIKTAFSNKFTNKTTTEKVILLVEDNEANIETITSYLVVNGYEVIIANNGNEAIELARKKIPNLILMDIQMPGMDGLSATKIIRTDNNLKDIPIIAMTALAMNGDQEKCLEAGVNSYISKPLKLKELVKLIGKFLNSQN
jgi:PAS domain S-box-containing protein